MTVKELVRGPLPAKASGSSGCVRPMFGGCWSGATASSGTPTLRGHHHAVEPLPAFAAYLREHFPSVEVHDCALSDEDGTATFFHVVGSPATSGFHQQDPVAAKETVAIDVAIRRIDDLVGGAPVRLIEVDVEGAEMHVFAGARGVIERGRPVLLFEHAGPTPRRSASRPTTCGRGWTASATRWRPSPTARGRSTRSAWWRSARSTHSTGYDRRAVTNWIARPR